MGVGFVPEILVKNDKSLHKKMLPTKYDDDLYITYDSNLTAPTVKEFINKIVAQ